MKIAMTGGTGFIGGHLERGLPESGFRFRHDELSSAIREIVTPAGITPAVSEWANVGPKS